VLGADWPAVVAARGPIGIPPLLAEVAASSDVGDAVDDARLLSAELAGADPGRRREVLGTHVRAQLAHVLALDPNEPIDPFQGLTDLGMDSLMAVELSNRLSALVRRTLPSTLALEEPTLNHLVDHLVSVLSDELEFTNRSTARATESDDGLATLSEDELRDALVRELEATGY
jgi:acyl carrier protein